MCNQTVAHLCSGILPSSEKEEMIDTTNSTDEFQICYAK